MKNLVLWSVALLLVSIEPVYAYIDPGSGSAIMSVIIGFFVATGVLIKTFWYKIKSLFGFSKTEKKSLENKPELSEQDKGAE